MTEEEIARFALVLEECERIHAQIVEDEAQEEVKDEGAIKDCGGDDGEPSGAALLGDSAPPQAAIVAA